MIDDLENKRGRFCCVEKKIRKRGNEPGPRGSAAQCLMGAGTKKTTVDVSVGHR